jgi:hypothetical protein
MVRIHAYGYRPKFRIQGTGKPTLGFELEVNCIQDQEYLATVLQKFSNYLRKYGFYVYFQEDSSTHDDGYGCEIVSHPFTFSYLLARQKYIASALKMLIDAGVRSYQAMHCGFHVHIGRDSFDDLQHAERFVRFFYEYKDATKHIADRQPGVLQKYASLNNLNDTLRYIDDKDGGHSRGAVHVNCKETLEVRIYRGNLIPTRFFASLEHVKSVYDFTKIGGNMKSYFKFLNYFKHQYPNLCHFMIQQRAKKCFKSFPIKTPYRSKLLCV